MSGRAWEAREGGLGQVRSEGVQPLEAERPELPRGVRGDLERAEYEARGGAAGGVDGEPGRGRRREASHEGLHLSGGRHGQVGAGAEEDHKELQRRRLHGAVAFGLVLGLVVALIVVVELVVLAVVDWRRRTPVRRAVVLESEHGRWQRRSDDSGDGGGADSVGLRKFFSFLAMGTATPESREGRRERHVFLFFFCLFPRLRPIWRNSSGTLTPPAWTA
jgi:hypothetical protein